MAASSSAVAANSVDDPGVESARRQRAGEDLFDRAQARDRLLRIGVAHRGSEQSGRRRRGGRGAAVGPDGEREERPALVVLLQRQVERRIGRLLHGPIPRVGDDADDLVPLAAAEQDDAPDRIAAAEIFVDERLVDDEHRRRVGAIGRR